MRHLQGHERPILRPHLSVKLLEPNHVFVFSGMAEPAVLTGDEYEPLLSLLDGRRTVEELALHATIRSEPAKILYALATLEEGGFLSYADGAEPGDSLWSTFGLQAPPLDTVALVCLNGLSSDAGREALHEAGLSVSDKEDGSAPVLVLAKDYLASELEAINRDMLATGRLWMLGRPVGRKIWIGPAFVPGRTACWACMAFRLRLNRQIEEFFSHREKGLIPALPLAEDTGASLASFAFARWLAGDTRLEGQLLTCDVIRTLTESHRVTRRPQCSACGTPDLFSAPQAVLLRANPKPHRAAGSHRSATAAEVVAMMQSHISPLTGVVSWVKDTLGAGHGISYNAGAGHNFVVISSDASWLLRSTAVKTGGKGGTREDAQASAIGEAVERYSGVYRGDEACLRAAFRDLPQATPHPSKYLLFSEAQYASRVDWNKRQPDSRRHSVPNPFDESIPVDWTSVWSLTHNRFSFFLASFCYYGHADAADYYFCSADSNGCAAGNTLVEAIVEGFLELVERDAVALWWFNRVQRPGVDLDTFPGAFPQRLQRYYASLDRDLWALDLTTDLGIPAFAALSRRMHHDKEEIIFGFGAHLDPQTAMQRALSELNQLLPAVSRRTKMGKTIYAWPESGGATWWQHASVRTEPYLLPDPETPMRTFASFTDLSSNDTAEDVRTCVALAKRQGLEVFALDQSRPDIPIHVARVIVPQLRHFWRRLGPGRLYDVPVSLGWLPVPTSEDELNPHSIFI